MVGNPQAIPKCTDLDFQAFNCPTDSQVGILNASFVTSPGVGTTLTAANLAPTTLTADAGPCNELCQYVTLNVADPTGINYRGLPHHLRSEHRRLVTQGQAARPSTRRCISITGDTITALTGGPVQSTCGPNHIAAHERRLLPAVGDVLRACLR